LLTDFETWMIEPSLVNVQTTLILLLIFRYFANIYNVRVLLAIIENDNYVSIADIPFADFLSFFFRSHCRCRELLLHLTELHDTHTNTHTHKVGFLWMMDRTITEISTWQSTIFTRDKHPCSRWDSNPQSQQASCRRLMY